MIDIQLYRMRIGLHYALHCKVKGLKYLSSFELLIILSLLLIRSGDIELNSGPNLLESESDSITMDDVSISKYFSIVHYNITSVMNKIDLIGAELNNFSVICLTETWLNDHTANDSISLDGYKLYRRDRGGDNHGGICVYTEDNVFSRRRNDLELPNIECIWIEITVHHRKFLLGTFYRPPNPPAQTLSSIEDSIGLAFDSNINGVFITGDFNLDTLKNTSNQKISAICQQFGVTQMIVEPTHFTEHSSSIIDLIFMSNKNSILLSGVGEPFLDQNVRWKTLKQFIKPGQSSSVPPLYKDDIIYTEEGDKATLMNNFFVAQSELDETQATLPPDITLPEHSLNFLSSSPLEVETMFKSLQLGKATGPDAINNRVLKKLAKPLSFPLSDLFNFSLTSGKVPLIWKVANVTPIFKKDDPSVVSNYRHISLLSTVGKVLEKIVLNIYLISFVIITYLRLYSLDLFQVTLQLTS